MSHFLSIHRVSEPNIFWRRERLVQIPSVNQFTRRFNTLQHIFLQADKQLDELLVAIFTNYVWRESQVVDAMIEKTLGYLARAL